jgi:hypothetical protein
MAKTSVDIDMQNLDKVRGILGTEPIQETISAAFREVIRIAVSRYRRGDRPCPESPAPKISGLGSAGVGLF